MSNYFYRLNPHNEPIPENLERKSTDYGESCIPSNLWDDRNNPGTQKGSERKFFSSESENEDPNSHDAEKLESINSTEITFSEKAVEITSESDFPAPIGHGRARGRNKNSQSDDLDFEFLNSMSNDWSNMTKKLKPEQISSSVWGPQPTLLSVPPCTVEMTSIESQTDCEENSEGHSIIIKGNYEMGKSNQSETLTWSRNTMEASVQVNADEDILEAIKSDPYEENLRELSDLFPNCSLNDLEYYLTMCNGEMNKTINKVWNKKNLNYF